MALCVLPVDVAHIVTRKSRDLGQVASLVYSVEHHAQVDMLAG